MCTKEQHQNVRGLKCLKATWGAILHVGGYKKVDKMTLTVMIKHQMVTVPGRHGQPKSQAVTVLGRDD